jgi:hypothetical protein
MPVTKHHVGPSSWLPLAWSSRFRTVLLFGTLRRARAGIPCTEDLSVISLQNGLRRVSRRTSNLAYITPRRSPDCLFLADRIQWHRLALLADRGTLAVRQLRSTGGSRGCTCLQPIRLATLRRSHRQIPPIPSLGRLRLAYEVISGLVDDLRHVIDA